MQILEDQHPAAFLNVLILGVQRRPGADFLQNIIEAGQGQVRMFGLDLLAGCVEFLAEVAESGADGVGRVGERESAEALRMIVVEVVTHP